MDDVRRELDRLTLVDGVSVRTAGLLECCKAMLRESSRHCNQEPGEGELKQCRLCGEQVVYRHGAWEWWAGSQ